MKRATLFLLLASGCGTATPGNPPPKVIDTVPADGATGVSLLPDIVVTFDRAMDPATVDTNVANDTCSGAIGLSDDDFVTCVPMTTQPAPDGDAQAFTVRPAAPLAMLISYKVRVRRSTQDADGRQPSADFEMTTGFTTRTGPTVVSVSPVDGTVAFAGTSFSVTFSGAMDPATVTANVGNDFCTGSVQVSSDGFATCLRMQANPSSGDGLTYVATAAVELAPATTYKVRVTAAAQSAAGNPLAYEYESATGFVTRYFHTISIGPPNDFDAATERFASTSAGYSGYYAWDETWLYFGMEGADIGSNSATKWVSLYVSGSNGAPATTAGQTYNTQQSTLPFPATWHVRWKADNSLTTIQRWNGAAWEESGLSIAGDVYQSGTFLEMRLRRADLFGPAALVKAHLTMLNELAGVEATYAGVPSTSFTDGFDPTYSKYYELNLAGSAFPNAHQPLP